MNKLLLLFLSSLIFITCKTQDYKTPYEYEKEMIIFGNGGGFSGRVQQWTLLDNGQLFKGTNQEGNVYALPKIDKDQCQQIFANYKMLNLDEVDINAPGNMYFYINKKDKESEHEIMWGAYDAGESTEIRLFYANLISLTKGHKTETNKNKSTHE